MGCSPVLILGAQTVSHAIEPRQIRGCFRDRNDVVGGKRVIGMWHIDLPACCALALKMVYPVPDRVLVSNLPDDLARNAYFIPMPDVKSALRSAVSKPGVGGGQPRILVMPHGGLTCPVPG